MSIREALGQAIVDNDFATFKRLLSEHPEGRLYDGKDACLPSACNFGRLEFVQYLIGLGTDVNERLVDGGEPAIFGAVCDGHIEVVRWLLEHGAEINEIEPNGHKRSICLSTAARKGYLDIVKLLVDRGANVNSFGAGATPLSHAMAYGHTEVANYLRSVGAKMPEELAPSGVASGHTAAAPKGSKEATKGRSPKKPAKK
jgi:ankyrin repeat protein